MVGARSATTCRASSRSSSPPAPALAGLAGVIGGNYQVTEPAMAFTMGPIVFVVVVFGGLGSLTGCFIASLLMGLIQTFAVVLDVFAGRPAGEVRLHRDHRARRSPRS